MVNRHRKNIDSSALVSPQARIADEVRIGEYTVIGPNVRIGRGTVIGSHAYIDGHTTIGRDNYIGNGVSLGMPPQDTDYEGEDTRVEIGDNNVIREFASVHRGTNTGDGLTKIGDDNQLRVYSHVAYNCKLGNGIVLENAANLAGHVWIDDLAHISELVGVHQHVRIGKLSHIGGHSKLIKDIPPYFKVSGHPAQVEGLNYRRLRKQGLSLAFQHKLEQAYQILYDTGYNLTHALTEIERQLELDQDMEFFVNFLKNSDRGICR